MTSKAALTSQYSFSGRNPGEQIECQGGRSYTIVDNISVGGYGAVYKVRFGKKGGPQYAMKEEKRNPKRNHFKLVMEIRVLEAAKALSPDQTKHFPALVDKSIETREFMFIVMTLLGESLADIKYRQSNKIFSMNTGLYCAIECLEAIKDLHAIGFVHRDIKPANFVLGLPKSSSQNLIYMVDFGIARKIVGTDGCVIVPRSKVRFKGTTRFAPLAMHNGEESGRKDDCERWVYMLADMINKRKIPWYSEENTDTVKTMKTGVFEDPSTLFPGTEFEEFRHILVYLSKRHYVDKLDYDWMREMVRRVARRKSCSLRAPFDW
ncbi:Protein kinase domain-containing protein [Meloidogyne graminicola]|uniref:non-specific serine/threonine protein kinase n=1 Tax=Meloidogyne graminicola TaxID=189291 RepID=A0A8S9ZQK4_9BILA|nr:Protein kinase domain-containing protein [Meloidogyne graminicola]